MEQVNTRVRIAPSPTGDPHVGLAYITLFNYVFTKQSGGQLVLRIEDTDQKRYRKESEERIMSGLRWLGLNWDEGPDCGGAYGPYRQSERREIYRQHVQELLERKKAYRCFCSPETLQEIRVSQRKKGLNIGYDGRCKELSKENVEKYLSEGQSHTVRMIVERPRTISFRDELRGDLQFESSQVDDQVIMKSDGFPTYHLANVVDDYLMKITHVVRAEEWISSTPKHVLLYEAFGWEPPQFIHMPLLRNKDKSKISKRKNPISLDYYRERGVLPEAMVNFLGLMGWSLSGTEELFSLEQMQEKFGWKQMHLGGPVFDLQKLQWINGQYIQKMEGSDLADKLSQELFSPDYLTKIVPLVTTRLETLDDFIAKNAFFFVGSLDLQPEDILPKTKSKEELGEVLGSLLERLDDCFSWKSDELQQIIKDEKEKFGWKPREYFMSLRKVLTGRMDSPPLDGVIEVLGRERVRSRVRDAISILR